MHRSRIQQWVFLSLLYIDVKCIDYRQQHCRYSDSGRHQCIVDEALKHRGFRLFPPGNMDLGTRPASLGIPSNEQRSQRGTWVQTQVDIVANMVMRGPKPTTKLNIQWRKVSESYCIVMPSRQLGKGHSTIYPRLWV